MTVTPSQTSRRLFVRDNSEDPTDDGGNSGNWGPLQIAAPVIVGVVLLLIFLVYVIRQRRPSHKHDYDYHKVQTGWITKIFVPRRTRQRPHHPSTPMSLDHSMRTSRQHRSDSSDSQTPLTHYHRFDYPPNHKESPPPMPKRRAVRWWWLFGSRPQQIKSQDPGSRWRVDGPDGSSTGHGHEDYRARYMGYLATMREDPDETDSGVASTPTPSHRGRSVPVMTTVRSHPGSITAHTPIPGNAPSGHPGWLVPSANLGLPPSYDISQTHLLAHPSAEQITPTGSHTAILAPLRTAAYPSPRGFHGRDLSSDSSLASQPPMAVATSLC